MRCALGLTVAALLGLASCEFAVKHPAATVGVVGGTLGLGTCEIGTDFGSHGTCAIVGAGAAVALGGIVFLAILLGGEGDSVLTVKDEPSPPLPLPPSIDDPAPPSDAGAGPDAAPATAP